MQKIVDIRMLVWIHFEREKHGHTRTPLSTRLLLETGGKVCVLDMYLFAWEVRGPGEPVSWTVLFLFIYLVC
jgi:hypothetical protein